MWRKSTLEKCTFLSILTLFVITLINFENKIMESHPSADNDQNKRNVQNFKVVANTISPHYPQKSSTPNQNKPSDSNLEDYTETVYQEAAIVRDIQAQLFRDMQEHTQTMDAEEYLEDMEAWCRTDEHLPDVSSQFLCPCVPPRLLGPIPVQNHTNVSWAEINSSVKKIGENLALGGRWKPTQCQARRKVAIIVPFRDREADLKVFLAHMHPILQHQLLDYQIFVVEQEEPITFNKGAIMNAAFLEIFKQDPRWDCIVFHDVDVYMEDDRNMIHCRQQSHVSLVSSLDRWHYKIRYWEAFGGAVAVTPDMVLKADGYSNSYFGFSGEDDDFQKRLRQSGFNLWRPALSVARYKTLDHSRDLSVTHIKRLLRNVESEGGLSSIRYQVITKELKPLYTWFWVHLDIDGSPYEDKDKYNYTVQSGECVDAIYTRTFSLSRVSCQFLCDHTTKCAAYTYISSSDTMEHCIILNTRCKSIEQGQYQLAVTYTKDQPINENLGK